MKLKSLTGLVLVFVLFAVFAATAHAVPVTIESVEINGDEVKTTDQNKLDLVRGQDLDVKVRLNATGNGSDVEVRAFVSGFEFNREDPISDVTPVFGVDAGVTYVKRLRLRLPDLADEDNYLLRIIIADRFGAELIQSYRIRIDVPRHNVAIKDVVLNPDNSVVAGRALLVTVRVKNMGSLRQTKAQLQKSFTSGYRCAQSRATTASRQQWSSTRASQRYQRQRMLKW
ncbi:hypothetical protein HYU15_04235 [Candidatus Woesearchaeota archaeon]|nr:hypothetical protein [Candidatus Woesearchaeota archaeon]